MVGIFGVLLIAHGVLTAASLKYFSFFNKIFFIEPLSTSVKKSVLAEIVADQAGQRYGSSTVAILLGIAAVAWALGWNFIF